MVSAAVDALTIGLPRLEGCVNIGYLSQSCAPDLRKSGQTSQVRAGRLRLTLLF